jgi:Saxitoxin biosynthesis operon protein SxtJ
MQTHEDFRRHHEAKKSSDRSFGLVFALGFAIIAFLPLVHHGPVRWWSFGLSTAFVVLALAAPSLLGPLNRVWTHLGVFLNTLMSPILMGILFFFVFTPVALVMRLLGSDPLCLRSDRKRASYWRDKNPPGPAPDTMASQF